MIQLAVTPRLLARWGVGGALTVLPILLVATASGFALTGALIAIIALKLADGGLRHSLHRVASEILYLPVPVARARWLEAGRRCGQPARRPGSSRRCSRSRSQRSVRASRIVRSR